MKHILQIILSSKNNLVDAIKVINEYPEKLALICEDKKLIGVVTDGDIRRALLGHLSLETELSQIMCDKPITANVGDSAQHMAMIMRQHKIQALPIVDEAQTVVGVETYMQATQTRSKQKSPVFLMAGGFGTRLRPLTKSCPKPLLKVGPRPLLESIILSFIEHGFEEFYISLHYLAEQVREYFGSGEKWGVKIKYVEESTPLGTAGALSLIEEDLHTPIIVMNGDLLTKVDFKALLEFHESTGSAATMCVREYSMQVPYGVIKMDGSRMLSIHEKPEHHYFVNAGIYVLSDTLVNSLIPGTKVDMPDLLAGQVDGGNLVSTFPLHEYWLDIGRVGDFERAQQEFFEYFN